MGTHPRIPSKGDRIARRRTGITRMGVVWYADDLQVLVKWDDGKSSSLRVGHDDFSIVHADSEYVVDRPSPQQVDGTVVLTTAPA